MYFLGCANYMQLEKGYYKRLHTEPVQELNSRALHKGMYVGISLYEINIPLSVQIVGGQWFT